MHAIYTALYYLAIPFVLLRLVWKACRSPAYLQRIPERFGVFKPPLKQGGLWIHCVSVGETVAAAPFIKRLQRECPQMPITVTTMTPTGSTQIRSIFGQSVFHVYVPYDVPGAIKRFLQRVKPQAVMIMETEIWPNLIHICWKRHLPMLLANARMSVKSAKGYARFGRVVRQILSKFTLIAAQGQLDAQRFVTLGADEKRVVVTGNMKFDQHIPASTYEKAASFRNLWTQRMVWVAASTHEGEDELILHAHKHVQQKIPNALLVLVPRHPERFSKVATLCRKQGFTVQCRSEEHRVCPISVTVFIGDSMGELSAFYAASDVAFVGGSLVPTGGHNLLEPAALGIAAVTGPHVFNFTEITAMLIAAGAVRKVSDEKALAQTVIFLLKNNTLRVEAGAKGQRVVADNRGSVEAHVKLFYELITCSN